MGSFERALKEVLEDEGGYVNHPKDKGRATNQGVTQAVYDDYRRSHDMALVGDAPPCCSRRPPAHKHLRKCCRRAYNRRQFRQIKEPAVIYETFFANIRKSMYGGSIPSTAVTALRLIIAEAEPRGVKIADLAYMMATAFHEVGPALIPKRESLNYSASALIDGFSRKRISVADANRVGRKPGAPPLNKEAQKKIANLIYGGAWGKANLGNVKPNDGWDYRGGGYPQVTGLANYDKVSKLTGIDLVARPERITEQDVACISLVVCMIEGTYTGRKLSSYNLPAQFKEARAIINNDVSLNGEKIAGHARKFMAALTAAGYMPGKYTSVAAPVAAVEPVKAEEVKSKVVPAAVPVGTLIAGGAAGFAFSWWDWIALKFCAWFSLFCGG